MSDNWMQSLDGNALEVVHPLAGQVDFREIATVLANINRYNGHVTRPVSVAFHTIIGHSMAPTNRLKELFLLHDAHEYIVGDIATPVAYALAEIAYQMEGHVGVGDGGYVSAGAIVKDAIKEMKRRHDVAIHEAAGVEMPNAVEKLQIVEIDLRALNTERRDFLLPPPKPWGVDVLHLEPSPADWRRILTSMSTPDVVGTVLYQLFAEHLPNLQKKAAA